MWVWVWVWVWVWMRIWMRMWMRTRGRVGRMGKGARGSHLMEHLPIALIWQLSYPPGVAAVVHGAVVKGAIAEVALESQLVIDFSWIRKTQGVRVERGGLKTQWIVRVRRVD